MQVRGSVRTQTPTGWKRGGTCMKKEASRTWTGVNDGRTDSSARTEREEGGTKTGGMRQHYHKGQYRKLAGEGRTITSFKYSKESCRNAESRRLFWKGRNNREISLCPTWRQAIGWEKNFCGKKSRSIPGTTPGTTDHSTLLQMTGERRVEKREKNRAQKERQ